MMPTGIDAPSTSELVPFRSTKVHILKSGILIPFAITAAASVLLFSLLNQGNFRDIMYVFSFYLLFILFYAAYAYSGTKKSVLIYFIPAIFMYIALNTPIFTVIAVFFRNVLPGNTPENASFPTAFVTYFFGAGMAEELTKAIPGLAGLVIALRFLKPELTSKWRPLAWLSVVTPLDGVLMGAAAGVGFVFDETLFQYVPNIVDSVAAKSNAGTGIAYGFALLIPRLLNSVIGHMAWAGTFGYFIGLAAKYPKHIIKLLAIGWLLPAVLHGFWDATSALGPAAPVAQWVSAGISLVVFVYCLMKAKQIYATEHGGVSTESVIIGSAAPSAWAGAATPSPAPFKPTPATPTPVAASPMPAPVVQPSAPAPVAQPPVVQASAPAPIAAAPLYSIAVGETRFGIVVGQTIDLATLFPVAGLPQGSLVAVEAHPQDQTIVGLKNMTQATWAVELESGATTAVAPGRNVKLVAGEKITIGTTTITIQKL
jgi:RsiW-degrading membrane proteinase PrsW (M82 family)